MNSDIVVSQRANAPTHPYRPSVNTSYSVQWDECFPKGLEAEKSVISKLMKDNYVSKVINCTLSYYKLQGSNEIYNLAASDPTT
jgi:hypothetical protein